MSQLGKILLGVALAGALAALGAGFLLIGKYNTEKQSFTQVTVEANTAKQQVKAKQVENDALTKDKADVDAKLTESNTKVDDLTSKLATTQKNADDAKAALQAATDATTKAQADLKHVTDTLNGMTPEAAIAAVKKAQDDLAADESEKKILQDQTQALASQIDDLKKDINNEKRSYIPPGVSGKVTYVNRAWNFVVLNVGLNNGVVPNGELIVYRDRNFLGKIKISSAEETTSVGDILPDTKADIQVGDNVLN